MKPSRLSTGSADSPWGAAAAPPLSSSSSSHAPLSFLRAAPSPSVRLQQEVAWNPAQVYVDLQAACQILSDRGWKLAAKWAAELWMGLPAVDVPPSVTPQIPAALLRTASSSALALPPPLLAYAKTLLDLGEFAHAAAVLSQPHATVERMPAPLADLTAEAISLRAYALYMAGERRKEEEHQEGSG